MLIAALTLIFVPKMQFAQDTKSAALDQNISISVEDESLSNVIEKFVNT
jgi:hypothetical protein